MNHKTNKIIVSITLVLLTSFNYVSAQGIDKNNLFETWYLDSYKIGTKKHQPSKKEKNDYIFFKKDMTFTSLSEGKKENGSWRLNHNGGYILMTDDNGEKIKAYIISLTPKTLVLRYEIKEIREIEVQYSTQL
jgi:hypothetical protein